MEIANIIESKPKSNIYGLVGNINLTSNNKNYNIITDTKFNSTVKEYLNSPKDTSSLKMALLKDEILTKKSSELSIGDLKKVSLAKALIENKEYIVLDYFDKELTDKEKSYFKRLWKKLTVDYKKTIIIFTNDITSLWDIAKEIILIDKNKVSYTIKEEAYTKVLDLFDKAEITKFIELIQAKGIDMKYYYESNELLKAIYRLKENG